MTNTTQFRALTTPSGKRAFEAYIAVWMNGDSIDGANNVAITSPSIRALEIAWQQITGSKLDAAKVQHVYIVAANDEMKNAPDVAPASAKVSCQFCGRAASFIIRKIAVCERRECKEKVG
jgi:hypothetical protein